MKNEVRHWSSSGADSNTDQLTAYDDLRRQCPVAYSDVFSYGVLGHEELKAALQDRQTFSNKGGSYTSIPNGLDPSRSSRETPR